MRWTFPTILLLFVLLFLGAWSFSARDFGFARNLILSSRCCKEKPFAELGISPALEKACALAGYGLPTEVQEVAIPEIVSGKNVVLQAQTGSGKTLCYLLPILTSIDHAKPAIHALINLPTRELGMQVSNVIERLTSDASPKTRILNLFECFARRQLLAVPADPPHIVIGNPSMLRELAERNSVRLNCLRFVVVDEVDVYKKEDQYAKDLHVLLSRKVSPTFLDEEKLLHLSGWEHDKTVAYRQMLKRRSSFSKPWLPGCSPDGQTQRQLIFCSASIPQRNYFARSLVERGWLTSVPELIVVNKNVAIPSELTHEAIALAEESTRKPLLVHVLRKELLRKAEGETFQALVFVDAAEERAELQLMLVEALQRDAIHKGVPLGEMIQCIGEEYDIRQRDRTMTSYIHGRCSVLFCSDLLTRGIDLPSTTHVYQFRLPRTSTLYLHRSGRTARCGQRGTAVTLFAESELFALQRFENELARKFVIRRFRAK